MSREFSKVTKRAERVAAGNACRICGIPKELSKLQFAHIYNRSLDDGWKRAGVHNEKWHDDDYVCSGENCLLLCEKHHHKIDSAEGRQLCTVEYLESLKSELLKCTALIKDKSGEIRRCKNSNGRGDTKLDPFRCHMHQAGGLEEKIEVATEEAPGSVIQQTQTKSSQCDLL
jgi:hypothetical protein